MRFKLKLLIIFIVLLSLQETFSAPKGLQSTCKSHFIQKDILNSLTQLERDNLEISASKLADLMGKSEAEDLIAKEDFNTSIESFISERNLGTSEQGLSFNLALRLWFKERIQFYIQLQSKPKKKDAVKIQTLKKRLEAQKKKIEIKNNKLKKMIAKYGAQNISEALISAQKEKTKQVQMSLNSDAVTADILFILNHYEQLEQTSKIFQIMVRYDDISALKYFIQNKVNMNIQDPSRQQLLHLAALHNTNPEVVQLLIQADQGASLNKRNIQNKTPLHLAVSNPNIEVLKALLAAGADRTLVNKYEYTLLHMATSTPKIDISILQFIIDLDGRKDINEQTYEGKTALHFAVESEDINIVEALLKAGANPLIPNIEKYIPLHSALRRNVSLEIIQLLITANPIQLSLKDNLGNTPLHLAARYYTNPQVIPLLVGADRGAQLNSKTTHYSSRSEFIINYKYTPLHLAIYHSTHSTEMVQALLEAGADPTVRSNCKQTPYDLALTTIQNEVPQRDKIIQLLQQALQKRKRWRPW